MEFDTTLQHTYQFHVISRFKISIIEFYEDDEYQKQDLNKKLNHLRQIFREGSFLACYEKAAAVSMFHLRIFDTDIRSGDAMDVMEEKESKFKTSTAFFHEMSSFKSNLNGNAFQEKCFIVLGFNLPESDSYSYFMENWRDLTGLGNLLSFLTPKYFIGRVSLLTNSGFDKPKFHFHFIVLVEIFFNRQDYIYLLDYVQKFRVKRNFGYISIYGEFPTEPTQNHHSDGNQD